MQVKKLGRQSGRTVQHICNLESAENQEFIKNRQPHRGIS